MSKLKNQIEQILKDYPPTRVTDFGFRSMKKQIMYVKERPLEYKKTLEKYFDDYNIDTAKMKDKEFIKNIYEGKEGWLKNAILYFVRRGIGYKHLTGHAIDISVKGLSLDKKKELKAILDSKGFFVLPESVDGKRTKYNVDVSLANVFHVDFSKGDSRAKGNIRTGYVNGSIYGFIE